MRLLKTNVYTSAVGKMKTLLNRIFYGNLYKINTDELLTDSVGLVILA